MSQMIYQWHLWASTILDNYFIYYSAGLVSSVRRAPSSKLRFWVQIPTRYSEWPSHNNNVGCLTRLKTSFELNPVTEVRQRTLPYLTIESCDSTNQLYGYVLVWPSDLLIIGHGHSLASAFQSVLTKLISWEK